MIPAMMRAVVRRVLDHAVADESAGENVISAAMIDRCVRHCHHSDARERTVQKALEVERKPHANTCQVLVGTDGAVKAIPRSGAT